MRGGIAGVVLCTAAVVVFLAQVDRSPWATREVMAREQPVEFSHEHHVAGLGIDCRHCHTTADKSDFAGIPPTDTCMNCHQEVWTDAEMLEPVRASWRDDEPLEWTRVHDMPDFVYFDHGVHVSAGVGCITCHGEVDEMPLTWKAEPMTMEWCLDCHRAPEKHLRPRDEVYSMHYQMPSTEEAQLQLGRRLINQYEIETQGLTNCSVCHR